MYKTSQIGKSGRHSKRKNKQRRTANQPQTQKWYRPPRTFCHGRFNFAEPLGKGGFAFVFAGWDNLMNENVAIKVENKDRKNASRSIKKEYRLLVKLCNFNCPVPKAIWCGRCEDRRVMVMSRQGESLSDFFKLCGKIFSLQTTLSITVELITILESLHEAGVLHRDIKLQNFLTGFKKSDEFYVCDFGLSDFYVDPENNSHIPLTKGHSRYGTVRYASLNNHRGIEQSRRDDLESLGFVLIYAAKGSVPWQTIRNDDRRKKWSQVYEMKRRITLAELCEGLPDCFRIYMEYVRSLEFDGKPEYDYLRNLFQEEYVAQNFTRPTKYDWETAIE